MLRCDYSLRQPVQGAYLRGAQRSVIEPDSRDGPRRCFRCPKVVSEKAKRVATNDSVIACIRELDLLHSIDVSSHSSARITSEYKLHPGVGRNRH